MASGAVLVLATQQQFLVMINQLLANGVSDSGQHCTLGNLPLHCCCCQNASTNVLINRTAEKHPPTATTSVSRQKVLVNGY